MKTKRIATMFVILVVGLSFLLSVNFIWADHYINGEYSTGLALNSISHFHNNPVEINEIELDEQVFRINSIHQTFHYNYFDSTKQPIIPAKLVTFVSTFFTTHSLRSPPVL